VKSTSKPRNKVNRRSNIGKVKLLQLLEKHDTMKKQKKQHVIARGAIISLERAIGRHFRSKGTIGKLQLRRLLDKWLTRVIGSLYPERLKFSLLEDLKVYWDGVGFEAVISNPLPKRNIKVKVIEPPKPDQATIPLKQIKTEPQDLSQSPVMLGSAERRRQDIDSSKVTPTDRRFAMLMRRSNVTVKA